MFLNFLRKKRSKGFTLVELLVAIIIVSVISTIGVASYTNYVRDSRDTSRKSSLTEIKSYLDQYYSANSKYPVCAEGCLSNSGSRVWIPGLEAYATILPTDPLKESGSPRSGKYSYLYISYNNGESYDLIGLLENSNDPYRCQQIKYYGGSLDSDLLCPGGSEAFKNRLIEVSRGLSLVAQTPESSGSSGTGSSSTGSGSSSSGGSTGGSTPVIPSVVNPPSSSVTTATVQSLFGTSTLYRQNPSLSCSLNVSSNPAIQDTNITLSLATTPPSSQGSIYIASDRPNSTIPELIPSSFSPESIFSFTDRQGRKYYQLASNTIKLPSGKYNVWCNSNTADSFCTGNPLCSLPNSISTISEYCDKVRYPYLDCGPRDNLLLTVNTPPVANNPNQALCTVSLNKQEILTGNSVSVTSTSALNGVNPNLFISRTDTKTIGGVGNVVFTDAIGHKYYSLGSSRASLSSSTLSEGIYKIWCNVESGIVRYSGNPFCIDGTAGSSCTGYSNVGTGNYQTLTVIDRNKANDPSRDVWVAITHPHFFLDPDNRSYIDGYIEKRYSWLEKDDGGNWASRPYYVRSWPLNTDRSKRIVNYSRKNFYQVAQDRNNVFNWDSQLETSPQGSELWTLNPQNPKDLIGLKWSAPLLSEAGEHYYTRESCLSSSPLGVSYPSLYSGRDFTSIYSFHKNLRPLSAPWSGSCSQEVYASLYREDIGFGSPGSKERIAKCDELIPLKRNFEGSSCNRDSSLPEGCNETQLDENAADFCKQPKCLKFYELNNNSIMCKIAGNLSLIQQRYAHSIPQASEDGSGSYTLATAHGCENVLYVWGENKYSNISQMIVDDSKYMRNGELLWSEYKWLGLVSKRVDPDNHAWWMSKCPWANFGKQNNYFSGIYKKDTTDTEYSTVGNPNSLTCRVSVSVSGNTISINSSPDFRKGESFVYLARVGDNQDLNQLSSVVRELGTPHYRDESGRYYFSVFREKVENLPSGEYKVWCATQLSKTPFSECSNNPFCGEAGINCYNIPPCSAPSPQPMTGSLFNTFRVN